MKVQELHDSVAEAFQKADTVKVIFKDGESILIRKVTRYCVSEEDHTFQTTPETLGVAVDGIMEWQVTEVIPLTWKS